jgi:hypothetical protein
MQALEMLIVWHSKLTRNLRAMQVKSKLKGHQKRITGLAFSNALNVLVSSGADAQVCSTLVMFHYLSLSQTKRWPLDLLPGLTSFHFLLL